MDSLTTAYLVCMLIGSGCAVGGAYAGNKAFPIESSAISAPAAESTPVPPPKVETPKPPEVVNPTADQINKLKTELTTSFGDENIANSILLFLRTPVKEWKTIDPDFSSLTKKFRQTLTHPNMNKCPQNLLNVCGLVSKKYSNIKDFVSGEQITELGDQTLEAVKFLENTAQTAPATSSAAQ